MGLRDMVLTPLAQVVVQLAVAIAYFALASAGSMLPAGAPEASAVWAATGLAIAAVVLWGARVAPAIFTAALLATLGSATTAIAFATAAGSTLEALVAGLLIARWSGSSTAFDTPAKCARFILIAVAVTSIGATLGVAAIALSGQEAAGGLSAIWRTWWLSHLASALLLTPLVVLGLRSFPRAHDPADSPTGETAEASGIVLHESEDQLRRLINGIHDYAIFMLDPDGRIVSWNAGAARIKQYTREEVLGKHVSLFYTPQDRATGLPQKALGTAAREGRYEGEGWRMRQNGTRFWANVVIDAIYDSHNNLIGFAKITRDVTEKREALLALEDARDQLAQAQKMETIGQVTGGVAHDFNNLLAALISSLHLLEKRLGGDPQARRLLDTALSAAERGASLTQRLLTFARRQDLKPEIVEIPRLIAGMTELIHSSIGPSITIETTSSGTWTTARVDPTQLELAIFNLALNARDAMPDGGALRIDVADEIVADATPGTELRPGRYVRIAVSDTGVGMNADTLKRAIEPFFTTKGIGKGTGLGLSMIQGLAAQSGGAMRIESTPGQGTEVTIWLPASEHSAPPAEEKQPDEPELDQRCHVLVVDDDPLVSMGTVAMLEDLGHSAIEASSGVQALAALDSDPGIDIVITDQAMPGMTGTELVQKIRAQRPTLPIILATGWAELPENTVPEFLRLSKPYRQEDLARALSRVRERCQQL